MVRQDNDKNRSVRQNGTYTSPRMKYPCNTSSTAWPFSWHVCGYDREEDGQGGSCSRTASAAAGASARARHPEAPECCMLPGTNFSSAQDASSPIPSPQPLGYVFPTLHRDASHDPSASLELIPSLSNRTRYIVASKPYLPDEGCYIPKYTHVT